MTDEQAWKLASFSAGYSIFESAVQDIEDNILDLEELAALNYFAPERKMRLVARYIELAETLRESLREVDANVLLMTEEVAA